MGLRISNMADGGWRRFNLEIDPKNWNKELKVVGTK